MPVRLTLLASLLSLSAHAAGAVPPATPAYGAELEGFQYPHPVQRYRFASQGQQLQMAYMDVAPTARANGRTAVLMHGKNFCGATWDSQITALAAAGYRVIAPDQIGFCASSKPAHYQYSFQQLAANTAGLLKQAGVKQAVLVAHSTGGMLATRYALMYPQGVSQLVMVNPIGLEDWKAQGVPYRSVDQWYERELKTTAEGIRAYESKTYYGGQWKPEYERWVTMLAGLNDGPGKQLVAWNSALIYDMIFTQPVYYEFGQLRVPTVLMIGDADTTAIGSDIAPPAVKARLGNYKVLGRQVADMLPGSRLIVFPGMGHAPQMQAPAEFNRQLIDALAK